MFIANTNAQQKEMLEAAGVKTVKELFKDVPSQILYSKINIPAALDEAALLRHMEDLSSKNVRALNFIGAGVYEHFIPSAVNAISLRGEFLSAYTPYQAEASQGTLQAIYEYQSSICALFEMDVCNASHYDGATALAEACGAASRITSKNKILIPAALNPHYKRTLLTYYKNSAVTFEEVNFTQAGVTDAADLTKKLASSDVAGVVIATPNFFGALEDADALVKITKDAGALVIAVVNPISLGVVKTPGSYGADFAVAEGQLLGNAMNFGGPLLGIFTCKKEHIRHTPGRIVGIAKDKDGNRSFVLTLQAREQHIRREKAASNICSNQALCALNAVVYLTLLGPEGLREVAELNLRNANKLKEKIAKIKGFKIKFASAFFNEFVIECPESADSIVKKLAAKNIAAGYSLKNFGFENGLLVCATETKNEADIDLFTSILEEK